MAGARRGPYERPTGSNIAFEIDPSRGGEYRVATLTGRGTFAPRLAMARAVRELLAASGWAEAERHFMQGDASTRAYERLDQAGRRDRRPDDLAAASGRTAGALRQIL